MRNIFKKKKIQQTKLSNEEKEKIYMDEMNERKQMIIEFYNTNSNSPHAVYFNEYCIKCNSFKSCFDNNWMQQTIRNCMKMRSYLENKGNIADYKQMFKEQFKLNNTNYLHTFSFDNEVTDTEQE